MRTPKPSIPKSTTHTAIIIPAISDQPFSMVVGATHVQVLFTKDIELTIELFEVVRNFIKFHKPDLIKPYTPPSGCEIHKAIQLSHVA